MKENIRALASRIVVGTGMSALGRRMGRRDGAFILYGHRVSDDDEGYMRGLKPEWLDEQLAYLTRHYEIIPLNTLVECLENGRPVPERSVVLTFDDGFRDNLTNAFPILQKHHAPATIFVVTGSLTHGDLPWSQRLGYLFQHTSERVLNHPLAGAEGLELSTEADRRAAYQAVKRPISRMGREPRDAAIAEIANLLRVEPPRDRMLSWDDARDLLAAGIEIGAHTYSHPLLAQMEPEEARWELRKSREDLKAYLGVEHPSFCFPGGSRSPGLFDEVRNAGYRSVFDSRRRVRVNRVGTVTQYSLSRVGLPNAKAVQLEAEIDGPFHGFRNIFHKD